MTGAIPKTPQTTKNTKTQDHTNSGTHNLPINKEAINNTQKPPNCSLAVTRSKNDPRIKNTTNLNKQ